VTDDKSTAAFDVAFVTEVPLMVGGQATLELPYGFLVQGEVGALPSAYVNAVDGILRRANAYDANTSQLIRDSLGGSMVVRASAGLRPFSGHGLELYGGYTLLSFGGGISARQTIESATGATLPAEVPDAQVGVKSTVHGVHATIGWRWLLADHIALRASLGYMQAVASSSRLEVPSSLSSNAQVASQLSAANAIVNTTLNSAYTKYMKVPVVGMSLAYRF
jgi:hypothetical protein